MEKKLRKSGIATLLYVISALTLVYACYQVGSTIAYINSYYSAYGMSPEIKETVSYVLQAAYQPLVFTVLLFAAAKILNEVRALNPAYYATDEEIALAKAQKKLDKSAKKENKEAVEVEASEPIVFEEKEEAPAAEEKEEAPVAEKKAPTKKPRRKTEKK